MKAEKDVRSSVVYVGNLYKDFQTQKTEEKAENLFLLLTRGPEKNDGANAISGIDKENL